MVDFETATRCDVKEELDAKHRSLEDSLANEPFKGCVSELFVPGYDLCEAVREWYQYSDSEGQRSKAPFSLISNPKEPSA